VAGGNIAGNAIRAGTPVSANEAVLDPTFTSMWGGMIKSLVPQADGKILVGGTFTSVNGAPQGHIARFHPDGSLDFTFAPIMDEPRPGAGPAFSESSSALRAE
jgi:hypothetical protein